MNTKILIRDYTEQDILIQDKYLNDATDEYLLNLGVDPKQIRGVGRDMELTRKNLNTPIKDRTGHNYAIDLNGKYVGIAVLKKIKFGESAELHGHIFDLKNRQQGIGSEIFIEIIKKAFETFDLKVILCDPSAGNPAPNALLQKMGLKIIKTYTTPAQGILLERVANRYEITKEFYLNLVKGARHG